MTETWTDCSECGETGSVAPAISRPSITLNPGATDQALLSGAIRVSTCSACGEVVHLEATR